MFKVQLTVLLFLFWMALHLAYIPFMCRGELADFWRSGDRRDNASKAAFLLSLATTSLALWNPIMGFLVSSPAFLAHALLALRR